MPDANRAFFCVMAVAIPLAMLLWSIAPLVSAVYSMLLLMVVAGSNRDDWISIGELLTAKDLTIAVLVGGTLMVIANAM